MYCRRQRRPQPTVTPTTNRSRQPLSRLRMGLQWERLRPAHIALLADALDDDDLALDYLQEFKGGVVAHFDTRGSSPTRRSSSWLASTRGRRRSTINSKHSSFVAVPVGASSGGSLNTYFIDVARSPPIFCSRIL